MTNLINGVESLYGFDVTHAASLIVSAHMAEDESQFAAQIFEGTAVAFITAKKLDPLVVRRAVIMLIDGVDASVINDRVAAGEVSDAARVLSHIMEK